MKDFKYTTTVEADTKGQADQVMAERLDYEEDYGFDYQLSYTQQGQYAAFVITDYGAWFHTETSETAAKHRSHIMALEALLEDYDESDAFEQSQIQQALASDDPETLARWIGDLNEEIARADITYGVMNRD